MNDSQEKAQYLMSLDLLHSMVAQILTVISCIFLLQQTQTPRLRTLFELVYHIK